MTSQTPQIWQRLIATSLLMIFTSACSVNSGTTTVNSTPPTPPDSSKLSAMQWQLASVTPKGQASSTMLNVGLPANQYQFNFKDGRVLVKGGCNILSGAYRLSAENGMVLGPMISTKRACERTRMEADNEILSYLSSVTNYSILNNALTLSTAFGQRLSFRGTATASTKYGGPGKRKFIEIRNSTQGLQWREAKYNSSWIRIKDNAAWETVYPGIQGFIPEANRQYIVRIFEYTDPRTRQPVWIKDMITMNGVLQ